MTFLLQSLKSCISFIKYLLYMSQTDVSKVLSVTSESSCNFNVMNFVARQPACLVCLYRNYWEGQLYCYSFFCSGDCLLNTEQRESNQCSVGDRPLTRASGQITGNQIRHRIGLGCHTPVLTWLQNFPQTGSTQWVFKPSCLNCVYIRDVLVHLRTYCIAIATYWRSRLV